MCVLVSYPRLRGDRIFGMRLAAIHLKETHKKCFMCKTLIKNLSFWAFGFLLLTSSCANNNQNPYYYSNNGGGQVTASFSSLEANVFGPSCVSCHSQFSNYSGVRNDINNIYNYVANGSMPRGGYRLSSSQINAIYSWMQSGAPNN
jgi:hypothetical protein